MKKFVSIVLLFFICTPLIQAQEVQRKLLVEQFTNASCFPCFTFNPPFDAAIQNNPDKVVPIKYPANWPGNDPLYDLNPSENDQRIAYYNVGGIPRFYVNGSIPSNPSDPMDSIIQDLYTGTTSPFSLQLSHSLNRALDSIFITVVIKNETNQVVSSNAAASLKLRVALIEEDLMFPKPLGTNYETTFHWIMRKMYPDADGTSLSDSWQPGGEQSLVFEQALPEDLHDYQQIATIAFIQDDQNQYVYQSERTTPITLTSGIVDTYTEIIDGNQKELCDSMFRPHVKVSNLGPDTLSSFDVIAELSGTLASTTTWTGSLKPNEETIVQLNPIHVISQQELSIKLANYSDSIVEGYRINDGSSHPLYGVDRQDRSFSQDFEQLTFDPYTFSLLFEGINQIPGDYIFPQAAGSSYATGSSHGSNVGGFGNSETSLFLLLNYPQGHKFGFFTDIIDLQEIVGGVLEFSLAYAQKSPSLEQLIVSASTDCGDTWQRIYFQFGNQLVTGTETDPFNFYPEPHEWKRHSIDISDYAGQEVLFRFEVVVGQAGYMMFIDDLEFISQAVNIDQAQIEQAIDLYPNPFTSQTKLTIYLDRKETFNIQVTDVMGRIVHHQSLSHPGGISEVEIDGSTWSSGMYRVIISSPGERVVKNIFYRGT